MLNTFSIPQVQDHLITGNVNYVLALYKTIFHHISPLIIIFQIFQYNILLHGLHFTGKSFHSSSPTIPRPSISYPRNTKLKTVKGVNFLEPSKFQSQKSLHHSHFQHNTRNEVYYIILLLLPCLQRRIL